MELFFLKIRMLIPLLALLNLFPGMAGQESLRCWEVFELDLKSSLVEENPYSSFLKTDQPALVTAKFTGTEGPCKWETYTLSGFWDGADIWKIRFAPPSPGKWSYETFSSDRKMNGKKGIIVVTGWNSDERTENPARHGFIKICNYGPREGRYFTYWDGTPFLWIADTWWDWTNSRITFDSFKKLADTRAEQGFNLGQLFFAGNGWGRESSLLDQTYDNPKLGQILKAEEMIRYANSRGITVWIHAWWSREGIDKSIGEEKIIRWWRYVIHRLQAYNVIWVLAGEYNMYNYGGFPPEFWNRLGSVIKEEDPYKRIVGTHPTPPMWGGGAAAPQWSTAEAIHDQKWLDYNQSQTGHARWCNELTPEIIRRAYNMVPVKPVVVTEPWYEFIEGNPTAMDIRFGAWSSLLSGAAGHTYGGGHTWRAHLPEKPAGVGSWPMDTSFKTNTLSYPGAISVGFMGKVLRGINWYLLEPHPELVLENPSHYCLAIPGEEYLFYLRYGGSVKVDLTMAGEESRFEYIWTDLVNSRESKKGLVNGGKITEIKCPEDYPGFVSFKDWLLYLKQIKNDPK